MMSSSRKLNMLLLFLSASPLFTSHLLAQAFTTSFPPILNVPDYDPDYDKFDEEVKAVTVRTTKSRMETRLCPYDPCSEDQQPCHILAQQTKCLCPGMSGPNERPHSARLHSFQQVSSGSRNVEVHWCAPSSVVTEYLVVIEGIRENLKFPATSRKGVVGTLESGTKVCVVAVNSAGQSGASEFSCMRYDTPSSLDYNVMAGVIGGGIVLLLLLVIASVVIWKLRMNKKAKRDSDDGLRNPSYSMGETS
ncbi:leucine-rich repeat neuronal protein 4 [Synchiropus splendidus]|uniref:leucine-rich repeat neuronal protein 4 n=1 Tax=Synchiropus splendidus TaxID=270530 RepID=UPI00237D8707|nr:leucine-rich repeat neuronal protein 4 [Synchiropus splendidus]